MFCAKISIKVLWEDSKKRKCLRRHNKQNNNDNNDSPDRTFSFSCSNCNSACQSQIGLNRHKHACSRRGRSVSWFLFTRPSYDDNHLSDMYVIIKIYFQIWDCVRRVLAFSSNNEPEIKTCIYNDHQFDSHLQYKSFISCLNFWDEARWFLSLRVFGLLSLSLLLFPQCFGRYVLRVFVELGNLHGTSNYVLYWIHGGRLFWFRSL